jgi:hypothetical protein
MNEQMAFFDYGNEFNDLKLDIQLSEIRCGPWSKRTHRRLVEG